MPLECAAAAVCALGAARKCLRPVRFGACVLVLVQGAAAGLLPDVHGSLSFGACALVFMAVHIWSMGAGAALPANIFCYLVSMLA